MQHARTSSGVYPQAYSGLPSNEALRVNAELPAGYDYGSVTPTSESQLPFYRRRKFLITLAIMIPLGIILLFVLLFPVVKAIAQGAINNSVLVIQSSEILEPTNSSFILTMKGLVTGTGPIPATISWTEPVQVSWVAAKGTLEEREVPLGHFTLDPLDASGGQAPLDQRSLFTIDDQAAFGNFTTAMITQPEFTWRLKSSNLNAQALKFPQASGLSFNKDLTIKGINKFDGGVKLKAFKLPQNDPKGGISFSATTELTNVSPFNVDLGTVIFNLYYNNVFLGEGRGSNVKIVPGPNEVTLVGRLISHEGNQKELDVMGDLFTKYLNSDIALVKAFGVSTRQADGSSISWLSQGLSALALDVPLTPPAPITPIRDIQIGYLNLSFSPDSPWAPQTSSDALSAKLVLPFGFDVSVSNISNTFSIMQGGVAVASLASPMGASTSDIKVKGPELTEGTIVINLSKSPLQVSPEAQPLFSKFDASLTAFARSDFMLSGSSRAVARLPIGQVILDPIRFNVPSGLDGLRGLNGMTTIHSVDVTGGTTDYMLLEIGVSIFNPSNLNLNTGDITLQLFKDGGLIGTALLPNLNLIRGNNTIASISKFTPNNNRQGLETLAQFANRQDTKLQIAGFDGSTNVASLSEAFKALKIDVTLPGLKDNLLKSTSLTVLPTTGHTDNVAHVSVVLVNPFTADLTITNIKSTVKSHGLTIGTIDTATNFPAPGKKESISPDLNLALNLDPPTMFTLVRKLAQEAGLSTDPIDGIMAIGGISNLSDGISRRSKPDHALVGRGIFDGFNLPDYVDNAFSKLTADISILSRVTIGQYSTTLAFVQNGLAVTTDKSLDLLLPILAAPIVQKIVTGATLSLSSVLIQNPEQNSFTVVLKGSITNAGPFDAVLAFGKGLTISYLGKPLGLVKMPSVNLKADVGAVMDVLAPFTVADVAHLSKFTEALLTGPEFTWTISGDDLTISAMGIDVPAIKLSKDVVLKGMNGLKDGVVINSFDLPSNDPEGGIHLTLQTTVKNPSQVGIQLNHLGFQSFSSNGIFLGPVSSSGQVTLAPQSSSSLPLAGRLVPQASASGLAEISQIFTDFVHGKDSVLVVQGASAGSSDITWLNAAIKSLKLSAVLPAVQGLQVIKSISLNEHSLVFTEATAFAPLTSSKSTTAAFGLPFAFPLDIVALQETITIGFKGNNMAQLVLPKSPAKTDVEARVLQTTFENIPFAVFPGREADFQEFLTGTTSSAAQTLHLSGSASTEALTAVGLLSITDIPFSVDTTITGINKFDGRATLSDVKITGSGGIGGNEFIVSPLKTILHNPSNISLDSTGISLPVFFSDVQVGRAVIDPLKLVPGDHAYDTVFRYQPQNPNDTVAQQFLTTFLESSGTIPLTIQGDASSTGITSLGPALSSLKLQADLQGIASSIVTHINVYVTLQSLKTDLVTIDFDVFNPLDSDLVITYIQNDSGLDGTIFAHWEHAFPSFIVPAKGTANSGPVPNVHLVQGSKATLPLIPRGKLDIAIAQTCFVGKGGYQIPWLNYHQKGVPTKYTLNLT